MESAKALAEKAILLKPVERLQLVEALLTSLDQPDPAIEEIWIKEAEARYTAYREGRLKTKRWEDIRSKYL